MEFKVPLIVFFMILNSIAINDSAQSDKLKVLIIINRNGDRTPLNTYPKDRFNVNRFWFEGSGQLTDRGKERMYNLGQFIAQRYANIVTDNPREVYARSSCQDRCLQSAQLLLLGMYPPTGKWIWNRDLKWQPISLKSECDADSMLNPEIKCPNADKELNRVHTLQEYTSFNDQLKDLYKKLGENTGMKVNDLQTVFKIHDILEIQQKKGWKLDEWVTESMLKHLKSIADRSLNFDYNTKLLQKFRSGVLMRKIRDILKDAADSDNRQQSKSKENDQYPDYSNVNKKIYIFTGHVQTIVGVLTALDVYNGLKPPFGATIFIEMTTSNTIRLLYLNETEFKTPFKLQLHDCEYKQVCNLNAFIKAIERVIPSDWHRECGYPNRPECVHSGFRTYAVILIVLGVIGVIAAIVYHYRQRNTRQQKTPTMNN